jgi:hypothetical protein
VPQLLVPRAGRHPGRGQPPPRLDRRNFPPALLSKLKTPLCILRHSSAMTSGGGKAGGKRGHPKRFNR